MLCWQPEYFISTPVMPETPAVSAMQYLTRYALRPSFYDHAYTVAMTIAYHEINQLQFVINRSMDIAQRFKLNFDVDRAPEAARIKELHEHIQKLEETAPKKTSSRIEKSSSSTLEQMNNGKKNNPLEKDDEEPGAAPLFY